MTGRSASASVRTALTSALCVVAGGVSVLTGCAHNGNGSSDIGPVTVNADKVDAIAAMLPDKVKQSGKLVIGVNVPYVPNEYKDARGKIIGFDADLMDAVAKVFGVAPQYAETDFDKIIPAVAAGTYDMGMSSFTDTKKREETVDFTTYFKAGAQWAQQAGKSVDPNNACGKKVAVLSGSVEAQEGVPAKSGKCVTEGKPAIDEVTFDQPEQVADAVLTGKVDAMSTDSPVTGYEAKHSGGKIEPTGPLVGAAPYGWPVAKGSPLAHALQKALQHLIDDGSYRKIAENWGLQAGMIDSPQINGAVN